MVRPKGAFVRAERSVFLLGSCFFILLFNGCGGIPSSTVAVSQARLSSTSVQATAHLSVDPASLAFGSVNAGASATLTLVLANSGSADAHIDSFSVSNTAFRMTGPATPFKLAAGYSVTLQVSFVPSSAGSFQGVLAINSSEGLTLGVPLSGTGTQVSAGNTTPVQHQVSLAWKPSTSVVDGYYVYRGNQTGGPYTRVSATVVPVSHYADATVSGGHTYYYVVTAVASGMESAYSMEIAAAVPSP
jgi:hypothetical protein